MQQAKAKLSRLIERQQLRRSNMQLRFAYFVDEPTRRYEQRKYLISDTHDSQNPEKTCKVQPELR